MEITTKQFETFAELQERKTATGQLARAAEKEFKEFIATLSLPAGENLSLTAPRGKEVVCNWNVRNMPAQEARVDAFFSYRIK